jgi:hypothetical protein
MDLLIDSGVSVSTSDDGFIESVMDISNPDGGTMYWSYWEWDGREWQFNETSASGSVILPGAVEAWHFASWETFPSPPPSVFPAFREICSQDSLVRYQALPFLSFGDLQKLIEIEEMQKSPVEEEETHTEDFHLITDELVPSQTEQDIDQPLPLATGIPSDIAPPLTAIDQVEVKTNLPFILIGSMGAVTLILIAFVLFRKTK